MLGDALRDNLQLPANHPHFSAVRENIRRHCFHRANTRFATAGRENKTSPAGGVTEM